MTRSLAYASSEPRIRWLLLLWLLLAGCAAAQPTPLAPGQVLLLKSEPTLQALGWRARWEYEGAKWALRTAGAEPVEVNVAELEAGVAPGLLVLPNVRNMAPSTVAAVRTHLQRGGKVLATAMTSYRRADNKAWEPNDLALGDVLGVHFKRWAGGANEVNKLGEIAVPRHSAMIVDPTPDATVLARWDVPEGAAAIVATPNTVYVGEDILAPELAASGEVQALLASLLTRLDPSFPLAPVADLKFPAPAFPFTDIPAGNSTVNVSLGNLTVPSVRVRVPGGEERVVTAAELTEPLQVVGSPYLELLQVYPNGTFRWAAYRGSLTFNPGFAVINEVPLDGYLAGVVPSEMPAWFPAEALKAQAIVARSYTLNHLKRHGAFDMCAEVHCQVYRGLTQEAPATTAAVLATLGQVLTFNGTPADGTFHAVCGGSGEEVTSAWPKYSPATYLVADSDLRTGPLPDLTVEENLRAFLDTPQDAYCSAAGRFRWEEKYPWATLEAKLKQSLPELDKLVGLEVTRRDVSGRVAELTVRGSEKVFTVGGDAVRWLLSGGKVGAGGLQSSLFYVDVDEASRTVRFRGGGWGHGVGLCQEGAAGRAKAGQGYEEILRHYYPGTELVRP